KRGQVVEAIVIFEEWVQQAALVPTAILGSRRDDKVHRAIAMNLAVHAEAFGEPHGLEGGGDASDVTDAGSQDVDGAALDPFGTMPVLAAGAFRSEDGNVEIVGKPFVGAHGLLIHAFLDPVEAELFEPAAEFERIDAAIPMEGVDHQVDVWAHRFANRGTGL